MEACATMAEKLETSLTPSSICTAMAENLNILIDALFCPSSFCSCCAPTTLLGQVSAPSTSFSGADSTHPTMEACVSSSFNVGWILEFIVSHGCSLVVVGWILVAGTFILCGAFLFLHKGKRNFETVLSKILIGMRRSSSNGCCHLLRVFTFKQLHSATGGFSKSNVVGHGEFGLVYRGVLNDGRKVAIKFMDQAGKQGEYESKVEKRL